MAVIRERQQFRNKRIGVVRADTGEQEMWQAVGRAADNITTEVFKVASDKAKRLGTDLATQVSQEQLRTINPETGRAEAFTPPQNLGTIAQNAYGDTMKRRYIRSAETEIKNKAQELFILHQYDPHGPDKYATDMQDYIENMVKTSDNQFSSVIQEVGSNYLASTKLNLMAKRAESIRSVEVQNLYQDAQDFAVSVQDFGDDFDSLDIAFQLEADAQQTALEAGILTQSQAIQNIRSMRRAIQQAPLAVLNVGTQIKDGEITREITPADAAILENAYESRGAKDIVDRLPTGLREIYNRTTANIGEDEDFDQLSQEVSAYRSVLNSAFADRASSQKLINTIGTILNGAGDNQSTDHRKAADAYIKNSAGITDQYTSDVFYRTPQSLQNNTVKVMIGERGVIPNGLLNDLANVANGMAFPPDQTQTLMQHYLRYASYTMKDGVTMNKWMVDGGLTDEQNAVLMTAVRVAQIQGSQDLPRLISTVIANRQDDDALGIKIGQMFRGPKNSKQGSLNNYLMDTFKNDSVMVNRMKPYAEYLIANGVSRNDLDDQMEAVFDGLYVKTQGLVLDVLSGGASNRSMYALHRTIPNEPLREMFINEVNKGLPKGFHLGDNPPEGSERVYLIPQDLSGTFISDEAGSIGVVYHAFYKGFSGELIPVPNTDEETGSFSYMSFSIRGFKDEAAKMAEEERQKQKEDGSANKYDQLLREEYSRTGGPFPAPPGKDPLGIFDPLEDAR